MGLLDQYRTNPVDAPDTSEVAPESQQTRPQQGILERFITPDPNVRPAPVTLGQELQAGLSSGTDQLQMSLFGLGQLVGRELGIESLEQLGSEGVERNRLEAQQYTPSVQGFTDVEDMDSLLNWAAGSLGNAIPSLGLAVGTGGAGGLLARKAVETSLRKSLNNKIVSGLQRQGYAADKAREAATRIMRSEAGFKLVQGNMVNGTLGRDLMRRATIKGGAAGAYVGSAPPQIGEAELALQEAGTESGLTAIVAGSAGGALEALPALRLLSRMFPGVDRTVSKSFVKDFAAGIGKQAALEGSTEGAQQLIQQAALAYHDPSFDFLDPDNTDQLINAFAAGALVGGVTGGAAEGAGPATKAVGRGFSKGVDKLNEIRTRAILPSSSLDFDKADPDSIADFEPADNTFYEEVKSRVNRNVRAAVEPTLNTVRDTFQQGIDQVAKAVPQFNGTVRDMTRQVRDAQREFVEGHRQVMDDVVRYSKEQAAWITEQAQDMVGDERREFVEEQMTNLKEEVDQVAAVLKERADTVVNNLNDNIARAGVFDDDFQPAQNDTRFIFGKSGTRGEETQGFKDRASARALIKKLREQYPSANDSSFEIRETEDGFVVAIADSGQTDTLAADEIITEDLEKSRKSTRKNPNSKRHISIKRTGKKGRTLLDVPTLVNTGKRLLNNREAGQQEALSEVAAALLERGMIDNASAQIIINAPQGSLKTTTETINKARKKGNKNFDPSAEREESANRGPTMPPRYFEEPQLALEGLEPRVQAEVNKRVNEQLAEETFPNAEERDARRTEILREELAAIDEDGDLKNLETEELGDEAAFIESGEGRNLESDDTQARRQSSSSRARPPNSKAKETAKQQRERLRKEEIRDRTKKKKARVAKQKAKEVREKNDMRNKERVVTYMKGTPARMAEAINQLVADTVQLLHPDTKVRVVDVEAAQNIVNGPARKDKFIFKDLLESHEAKSPAAVYYDPITRTATVIVDSKKHDADVVASTLVHELGHVIHWDTWANLSKKEQDDLWDAFVTDVRAGNRTTGKYINLSHKKQREFPGAEINIFEFREWMADQFVEWSRNRTTPKSTIQKFFDAVATKVDKLWAFVSANPGRFNGLNDTYADFMDKVAAGIKRNDPTGRNRFFEREAAGGRPVLSMFDGAAALDTALTRNPAPRPPNVTPSDWQSLRTRVEQQYPEIARRAALISQWMQAAYYLALAPATSTMRSVAQRVPQAEQLVKIFNRVEHGKAKESSNYHQRLKLLKGTFYETGYLNIIKGMSDADKTALMKRMREMDGDPNAQPRTPKERQLRALFDEMHDYLVDSGLPVGRIPNYFPRTFSRDKLIAGENRIMRQLMKRMPRAKARSFYNSLISNDADQSAALQEVQADELAMQSPSFRNMRSRTAKDKFFDQFLEDNLDAVAANYVNAAIKRGEFNRFLGSPAPTAVIGGDAIPKAAWNSRGKIEGLLKQAEDEGATEQDLKLMKDYVDANLGMYGRDDISDRTRTLMAAVVAYQNMRTLLFTVFASLPDVVGPAIRSGNMRRTFKTTMKNLREAASRSENDLDSMARAYGVASSTVNQAIMTEYVDNHYMPANMRKWNDKFFEWTQLNWWTDTTRKIALAVGVDTIKYEAGKVHDERLTQKERDRAKQFLAELGLDAGVVEAWVADGEQVWGSVGYDSDPNSIDLRVAEALIQFVDESIMSPNASQRPILASHPAAILVFHLKGYMYAMYDTTIKRMVHNYKIADTPAQLAASFGPALMMLALTALGLELRELVTGDTRTDRMDGWEYTFELVDRSGLMAMAQMGFDFEGAGARGQSELAALSGPTISQLGDLISKPASQTIPKAIPVVSQLPWARDALREATPL